MLSTNHRPEIKETKNAIWDRVHLIPWEVTIPAEEQDKRLKDKLRVEASGILRWAVEGCLMWQQEGGLNSPRAVRAATAGYREDEDFLGGFIESSCVIEDGEKAQASKLYEGYLSWAKANGEPPRSQKGFADRLKELGFERMKSNGLKFYLGLRLI